MKVLFQLPFLKAGFALMLFSVMAWQAQAQPANDLCANAIAISCGQTLSGTTVGATFDGVGTCGTTNTAPGVWYTFTPATSGSVSFSTCNQAAFDSKITVFSGSCGALTCVGGNDDAAGCGLTSVVNASVTAGTTYLILVHGFGTATGTFSLTVTCFAPVTNDVCANAIPITCLGGGSATGTTVGATFDGVGTCGTTNTSPGVWYSFVAGAVGSIIVETCGGATWDTKLTVFTGSCGSLVCVAGNDDACALQSRVTINNPVVGQTYYVLVHGFGAATGPFTLFVSNCGTVPVLTNDNCASATQISCGFSGDGTTVGATLSPAPACGTTITSPGVWYRFNANVFQMLYRLSTCNASNFDTKISVYVGTCGNLICIGSNDNAPGCAGGSSNLTFRPVWGADHYVLVHGAGSQTGFFNLTLTCGVPAFAMNDDPGQTVNTSKIALFPNPAQDVVNVDVRDHIGQTAIATVFNTAGQMVVQRNLGEIQIATERIELGNLPAGMYYLSLNVEGQGVFTEKFLVNNNR